MSRVCAYILHLTTKLLIAGDRQNNTHKLMEKNLQLWQKVTKAIFTGVLLYSVANVLHSILDPIFGMISTASDLASGDIFGGGIDGYDIFLYILLVGVLIGYYLFLKGLGDFRPMLEPADANSINQVRNGVILGILGTLAAFIPVAGWIIAIILNIIGFIFMLLGYSALKTSSTFPMLGRNGASKLFMAMILTLVGVILGIIPVVGGFIAMILGIVAFFLTLSGWASIKNSDPNVV